MFEETGNKVNLLDVESNGGDGGDDFTQLELVKYSCLSCGIQSNHEDADLFPANEIGEHL